MVFRSLKKDLRRTFLIIKTEMDITSKNWVFTVFDTKGCFIGNMEKLSKYKTFQFCCAGEEVCPDTGNIHYQSFLQMKKCISRKDLQRYTGYQNWCEPMKGKASEASEYCEKGRQSHEEWEKEGHFGPNYGVGAKVHNWGEIFIKEEKQGKRNDLLDIRNRTLAGEEITDLLEDGLINNQQQLRFAENLQKYRKVKRRETPEVYSLFGSSGTGKSFFCEKIAPDAFWCNDPALKWWDGYMGQEEVVIDEFRGGCPLSWLLRILDSKPLRVETKGGTVDFVPKRIFITSHRNLEEVYHNCGENLDQLNGRITHHIFSDLEFGKKDWRKERKLGGNTGTPNFWKTVLENNLDPSDKDA